MAYGEGIAPTLKDLKTSSSTQKTIYYYINPPQHEESFVNMTLVPPLLEKDKNGIAVRLGGGVDLHVSGSGVVSCLLDGRKVSSTSPTMPILQISRAEGHANPLPVYQPGKTRIRQLRVRRMQRECDATFSLVSSGIVDGVANLTFSMKCSSCLDSTQAILSISGARFELNGEVWVGYVSSWAITGFSGELERIVENKGFTIQSDSSSSRFFLNVPYGKRRGYFEGALNRTWEVDDALFLGQPFVLLADGDRSFLSFLESPSNVSLALGNKGGHPNISFGYNLEGNRGSVRLGNRYSLFLRRKLLSRDYAAISLAIDRHYRSTMGFQDLMPSPVAGASFNSQINYVNKWPAFADKVVPIANNLGFSRIYAGMNPTRHQQYNFEYLSKDRAVRNIKAFCDRAHNDGLSPMLWFEFCTTAANSALVKEHPEWVVIQRDGSAARYTDLAGKVPVLLVYPSKEYLDWLFSRLAELREKTRLDGVWLDSFGTATELSQYAGREERFPIKRILKFVHRLNDIGLYVYGESSSPYVHSSFWFRRSRFPIGYVGREWGLAGSSPYTNRPDSDFVDYFVAASYKCFPIIDIHPFVDGRRVYAEQDKFYTTIRRTNEALKRVADTVGTHSAVIDYGYAVAWVSAKGYAVFVREKLRHLVVAAGSVKDVTTSYCGTKSPPAIEPRLLGGGDVVIDDVPEHTVIVVRRPTGVDKDKEQ